jgi:FixJ family two-component response regulator
MEPLPLVFIVDDDASVRTSLERLMKSVGLRAETFASSQAFLQRQRHEGPSCLVLDVRLPGLSSLSLQEALAAEGSMIPIIFITGHGNIPMSVRAMKAGAMDFLPKPVRSQDLLEAVQQAIAKAQQARQERAAIADVQRRVQMLTPCERRSYLSWLTAC